MGRGLYGFRIRAKRGGVDGSQNLWRRRLKEWLVEEAAFSAVAMEAPVKKW